MAIVIVSVTGCVTIDNFISIKNIGTFWLEPDWPGLAGGPGEEGHTHRQDNTKVSGQDLGSGVCGKNHMRWG